MPKYQLTDKGASEAYGWRQRDIDEFEAVGDTIWLENLLRWGVIEPAPESPQDENTRLAAGECGTK